MQKSFPNFVQLLELTKTSLLNTYGEFEGPIFDKLFTTSQLQNKINSMDWSKFVGIKNFRVLRSLWDLALHESWTKMNLCLQIFLIIHLFQKIHALRVPKHLEWNSFNRLDNCPPSSTGLVAINDLKETTVDKQNGMLQPTKCWQANCCSSHPNPSGRWCNHSVVTF